MPVDLLAAPKTRQPVDLLAKAPSNAQKMVDVFDADVDRKPRDLLARVPRDLLAKPGTPIQDFVSNIGKLAGGAVSNIGKAVSSPLKEKLTPNIAANIGEAGGRAADVMGNMFSAAMAVPTGIASEVAKDTGAAKKLGTYVAGKMGGTSGEAEQVGKKLEKSTADTIGGSVVNAAALAAGGAKIPKTPKTALKELDQPGDTAPPGAEDYQIRRTTPQAMSIGADKPGRIVYEVVRKDGSHAGFIDIDSIKDGEARVGDIVINSAREPGSTIGNKNMKAVMRQVLTNHPEIKTFSGERVSGMRKEGQHGWAGSGTEVKKTIPTKDRPPPPAKPIFQSKIFSPDQPVASTKPISSVQGVADKLYQSRGAIRADYKEFSKWASAFKNIPKTFWQKALDHLDDPKGVPLTAEEKNIFDRSIGVMQNEINANRAEIKQSGFKPNELEGEESGSLGGAIRQRKGMGTPMDRITGVKTKSRPSESGRTLSRSAGTFKSRNMMALVKDGKRQIVHIDGEGNIFDANKRGDSIGHIDPDDEKITMKDGSKPSIGEATRKEIEAATRGEIQYHDNAFGVYATSLLQTRRALRSVRILNDIKKSPDLLQVARGPFSKGGIPKGWREIPDSPEFRGWRFEPRYAEEIEDFLRGTKRDAGSLGFLDRLNRFTLNLLFWANPIHAYNITDAFLVTKGAGGLVRDLKGTTGDLWKSVKSVATRDKYNMQQARAGVPLPGLDTAGEEFRRMTLDIMGVKARQDPANFLQFIKRFGFDKPADFFNRIGEISHKAVFSWQDVLQQTLERGYMRQGMSQAEATERVAKTFMNYRTPSRVMDQRWMGQALQGQAWLDFPKYAYGRLKGAYDMLSGAAKLDLKALDQLLMVAALYEFGQHAINPLVQQYTGKENAEFGSFGYTVIPELAEKTMEGRRTVGQDVQSLLSPGYLMQAIDLARGSNAFLGKPISLPGETPSEIGWDYASELANKVSPMQRFGQVASGRVDPGDLWLEQLGVKFPGELPRSLQKQLRSRERYGSPLEREFGQ